MGNPTNGVSTDPNVAGVTGTNTASPGGGQGVFGTVPLGFGIGVYGNVFSGFAIKGDSPNGTGFIAGTTDAAHFGQPTGVFGESINLGVYGSTTGGGGTGVYGNGGPNGFAMRGDGPNGSKFVAAGNDPHYGLPTGVFGESVNLGVYGSTTGAGGTGVYGNGVSGGPSGFAMRGDGPYGTGFIAGTTDAAHDSQHAGVFGESDQCGVVGGNTNTKAIGILAGKDKVSNHQAGVYGESSDAGVYGNVTGDAGTGVYGYSAGAKGTGVHGFNSSSGIGVYGESTSGQAGHFQGNVTVTGDITLTNADCAEDFDTLGFEDDIGPGTVVVIDKGGALARSQRAYDKRVAGVVSGAGSCKPAIVLNKQQSAGRRIPLAMLGKVYCKVDARQAPIEVGDLLTTSHTPGHAMKAEDPQKAFGAIIGKALGRLDEGQGLIPMLVALH